jgi:hypothetical protein
MDRAALVLVVALAGACSVRQVVPSAPPVATPGVSEAASAPAVVPSAMTDQTWTGSWEDPGTGAMGNLELVLTGRGSDFRGSIMMDGTACLQNGILVGSYERATIAFTVTQRGTVIEFEGIVDDAHMSGTFSSECDALDATWTVQRASR